MTTVLAVANQKGGVGKTTTAINLSAVLAERGSRVLLVDIDPQANATAGLGMEASVGRSTYQLLLEEAPLDHIVMSTAWERLWLAPSAADLAGAEVELATVSEREFRLRRALDGAIGRFDYIVIDCPPSLGLLTVNGLTAAQEALVPVQCEYLALEGLGRLVQTLELVRRGLNPALRLRGLLLTMYDRRTSLSRQVAEEVRRHFPNTFSTVIPRTVRLSEAPSHGLPIHAYEPRSTAAAAYESLADEVVGAVSVPAEVVQ